MTERTTASQTPTDKTTRDDTRAVMRWLVARGVWKAVCEIAAYFRDNNPW